MVDARLAKVQESLNELEKLGDLASAKKVVRNVSALLVPDLPDDMDELLRLYNDQEGKLKSNAGWFFSDSTITDRLAVYSLVTPTETNLDIRVFGVKKAKKGTISWAVGLSPNFEDEPFNSKFNVGIDFIIPESLDRVIVALSKNYVIRTLELKGQLTATFQEILNSWLSVTDLSRKVEFHETLWNSLDLSPINKKFYEGISQRFISLRQHIETSGALDHDHAAQFANRLIGRVIFTWFLDKKSLIEPSLKYFESEAYQDDTDYYREKLESLFFEVLNTPVSDRSGSDTSTPYLNGGLFEPKPGDLYKDNTLTFPKNFFDDFLSFLRAYNFTTDESTTEFQQVAIDPEMLGRIFENLLAEVSEDTGEQARKAKGAFYTPREIVDFMCRESLKAYLLTKFAAKNIPDKVFSQLIDANERDFQDQDHNWRRDVKPYKADMLEALDELRVLDPACGSGAFPMGMLQLLVKVLGRLETRFDARKTKLRIIEQNIFGVDIEPMAVEISRLRAWLALVVDEELDRGKVNPLPNLDFKFVCANTLIRLDKGHQATLFEDVNLDLRLQELRAEFFSTGSVQKKNVLKDSYVTLINKEQILGGDSRRTKQLKSFMPFSADSIAQFFDPFEMFGFQEFDVVIGNPPYVNVEKISKTVKNEIGSYSTAFQKYDLYVLFYERALELLAQNGILSFITSNKFLSQPYGTLLRAELLRHQILNIINFNLNMFESASVSTCILTLKKAPPQENKVAVLDVHTRKDADYFQNSDFRSVEQSRFETLEGKLFRLNLDDEKLEILGKIKGSHATLEQICSVSLGLKAHARDGSFKKSDLLHSQGGSGRRPFFEAKDIRSWTISQNGFINYIPDQMYSGMYDELFDSPKLAGPRIIGELSKMRFGYDELGMVCSHTAVVLVLWHHLSQVQHVAVGRNISEEAIDFSREFSEAYLQSVLNSTALKFYFGELMWDRINFYPNQMKSLPIPAPDLESRSKLEELTRQVRAMEFAGDLAKAQSLVLEIDEKVFGLFGLSAQEISKVRSWYLDLAQTTKQKTDR